jgi:iron(III) transport system substrate-binding protein
MLGEFEKRYEEKHPQVDVQWLDMGSQDVYDRIRTEKDNPQADIWWGAPSTIFIKAEKEGLLERYIPTWDSLVVNGFKSPHGFWFGMFQTPEVIAYNTHLLTKNDVPKDWDELLDAEWKGKILIRYPLASGTMRVIYCAMILKEMQRTGNIEDGFQWLRRLDANTKTYTADPTQMYLKLAREEGALTVWNLTDILFQAKENGYPFDYVFPVSGTPVLTEGIAIVKGTKHAHLAKDFYEFVTSKENLILQANRFHRIPTRKDVPKSELPAWMNVEIKMMPIDWALLAEKEKEWMQYWDENVKGKSR